MHNEAKGNRAVNVWFSVLMEGNEEGSIEAAAEERNGCETWEEAKGLGVVRADVECIARTRVEAKGGCERDEEEDVEVHEMVVVVVEVFKWLGFW